MAELIIVRGLPGSGKSTYAANLIADRENTRHYEADMFFNRWPSYKFEPRLISAAHDWCYSNVVRALWLGEDVVVSNTFTQMWEMDRYFGIPSIVDDVTVRVVEVRTQFQNIHGVPEEKLKQMAARWQSIPESCIENGLNVEIIL